MYYVAAPHARSKSCARRAQALSEEGHDRHSHVCWRFSPVRGFVCMSFTRRSSPGSLFRPSLPLLYARVLALPRHEIPHSEQVHCGARGNPLRDDHANDVARTSYDESTRLLCEWARVGP